MLLNGVALVAAERQRQLVKWTAEHDEQHRDSELAHAAACYASDKVDIHDVWPWDEQPEFRDELDNLTRAGALICAELDRILLLSK